VSGITRAWPVIVAAAAVAVVIAVAAMLPPAVPVESTRTTESPLAATATPSASRAAASASPGHEGGIVGEGDLVSMTGRIIDWAAGPEICVSFTNLLSDPPQPACADGRAISITGLDPRELSGSEWNSGREPSRKVWVTDYFRVFAIWQDPVVAFVDAIPAEQPHLLSTLTGPLADKLDADPPRNGERFCGRVDEAHCAIAIALVREARRDLFSSDSVEVVEYECPPGARCRAGGGYVVAVVPQGCPGIPIAFVVSTLEHFDHVVEYEYDLPAHVADLLPAECAVAPI
jgi:hypothetical protein